MMMMMIWSHRCQTHKGRVVQLCLLSGGDGGSGLVIAPKRPVYEQIACIFEHYSVYALFCICFIT